MTPNLQKVLQDANTLARRVLPKATTAQTVNQSGVWLIKSGLKGLALDGLHGAILHFKCPRLTGDGYARRKNRADNTRT